MRVDLLWALQSYLRIRVFPNVIRNRAALQRWQQKRLALWLRHDVPQVVAFADRPRPATDLVNLPVMDKAVLMKDFSRYTLPRITNAQGWQAFEGTRQIGDLIVGASTGTSGNRGLFVISQRERFAWLGAILAKAVPDFWRHRDRIAVLLPINTPLYDSANRTRFLKLTFFDISHPLESLVPLLEAFSPTLLIAPPRILRRLAEFRPRLTPRKVFSAAETLDPLDRRIIEEGFGQPLGQIYMATEGLLAVTCREGRLHLCEDCLHFEFEPAGHGLVSPVLTDFSRKTQIMARYRLNDLLDLDPDPCPCGSVLTVVRAVVGRQDDVICLASPDGPPVELTPDILRNTIVDTDRRITDFRLHQTGPASLELHLPESLLPGVGPSVVRRLQDLLTRHSVIPGCQITLVPLGPQDQGKLRRVRRIWHDTEKEP
jgi:putative adenylate-forming enzyme